MKTEYRNAAVKLASVLDIEEAEFGQFIIARTLSGIIFAILYLAEVIREKK